MPSNAKEGRPRSRGDERAPPRAYSSCRDAIPCASLFAAPTGTLRGLAPNVSTRSEDVVCDRADHSVTACPVSGFSAPVFACVPASENDTVYCGTRGRARG